MVYASRALRNVTGMAPGVESWRRYQNDLWHWFKHARSYNFPGLPQVDMRPLPSEEAYVAAATAICRLAAEGAAGSEVRQREAIRGSLLFQQYLVWYQPPGARRGLFLVVNDCHDHGELVTMFSPDDGRAYFDSQEGAWGH